MKSSSGQKSVLLPRHLERIYGLTQPGILRSNRHKGSALKSTSTPDLFDFSDLGFDDPEWQTFDSKAPLWEPKAWEAKTGTIQLKRAPDSFENSVGMKSFDSIKKGAMHGTTVSAQPFIRQWAQRIDRAAVDLDRAAVDLQDRHQDLHRGELKRSLLVTNSQMKDMAKEIENVTRERDSLRRQLEAKSKQLEESREVMQAWRQESLVLRDQLSEAKDKSRQLEETSEVMQQESLDLRDQIFEAKENGSQPAVELVQVQAGEVEQAWREECLVLGDQLADAKRDQNATLKKLGELDQALEGLGVGASHSVLADSVTETDKKIDEPGEKIDSLGPDPELDKQAIKIQATFRGKKARKEVSHKKEVRKKQPVDSQKQKAHAKSASTKSDAQKRNERPRIEKPKPEDRVDPQQEAQQLMAKVMVAFKAALRITNIQRGKDAREQIKAKSAGHTGDSSASAKQKEDESLRKQREAAEEEAAALRIQSVHRSKAARKEVQQRRIAKSKADTVKARDRSSEQRALAQPRAAEAKSEKVNSAGLHASGQSARDDEVASLLKQLQAMQGETQDLRAETQDLRQRLNARETAVKLPLVQPDSVPAESIDLVWLDLMQFLSRARSPEWDVVRVAGSTVAEDRDKVQFSEVQVDTNLEMLRLRALEPVGLPQEIPLHSVLGVSQDVVQPNSGLIHVKLGDPRSTAARTSELQFVVPNASARREFMAALQALGTSGGAAPLHVQPGDGLSSPSCSDGPTPRLLSV